MVVTIIPPPAESPANAMCRDSLPLVEQPAVRRQRVLDRRGVGVLGCSAVVAHQRSATDGFGEVSE